MEINESIVMIHQVYSYFFGEFYSFYCCFIKWETVIVYSTLTQTISTNFTSINIIDLELINSIISHIEKRAATRR